MTGPNWRDPKDYPALDSHDAPAFAWEFLKRDPEFRADQERLEQAARRRRAHPGGRPSLRQAMGRPVPAAAPKRLSRARRM